MSLNHSVIRIGVVYVPRTPKISITCVTMVSFCGNYLYKLYFKLYLKGRTDEVFLNLVEINYIL